LKNVQTKTFGRYNLTLGAAMPPNSLDLPETPRCAFCDYLNGVRPYTVLARTDLIAILITREQRGASHVLVLPIQHRPTLLDLTPSEANAVMAGVIAAARAIDASDKRPGIAVWQNNGVSADQTIPHVHFHVAGTLPSGGTERGEVAELSVMETDRLAAKLRPFLNISVLRDGI
jgi:histidine triad (HIT) family protein